MGELFDIAKAGRVWLLGRGDSRINPVHGADVAEAAIAAFGTEIDEIEVGGPEVFSYEEIGKLANEVLGRKPWTTHVPLWIVKAALAVLRRVNRRQYTTAAFLARMMQNDILGPRVGRRHLRDDFRARAGA